MMKCSPNNLEDLVHNQPHLFLPVEIQVRELHGKLLLAFAAAEAGFTVVIGGQRELRRFLYKFPPGLYLDKSVAVSKEKWFDRFQKLGHKILAWDEEGLVIHEKQYINSRFSLQSFNQIELFFAWGESQRNLIAKQVPMRKDDILLAGNPRFDLLRPEFRSFYTEAAQKLTDYYGKIILINTNFGFYNHSKGVEEGKRMFMKSSSHDNDSFIDNWIKFQKALFENFVALVEYLSKKYENHTVIVRPHPSESMSEWVKQVGSMPRVKVSKAGSVLEWIVASDIVIHSNCTTGIESYLLGVPTIAYRPIVSKEYESFLPNAVSINIFTFEDIKQATESLLNGENTYHSNDTTKVKTIASQYISNLHGKFSFDFIVEELLDINQEMKAKAPLKICIRYYMQVVDMTYGLIYKMIKLLPKYKMAEIYDKEKFPGVTQKEIETILNKFRMITERFSDINITRFRDSFFIIEKSQSGTKQLGTRGRQ